MVKGRIWFFKAQVLLTRGCGSTLWGSTATAVKSSGSFLVAKMEDSIREFSARWPTAEMSVAEALED